VGKKCITTFCDQQDVWGSEVGGRSAPLLSVSSRIAGAQRLGKQCIIAFCDQKDGWGSEIGGQEVYRCFL
jgi:hypothetical protein